MRNWKSHLLTFVLVFAVVGLLMRGCNRPPQPEPPTEDWRVTGGAMSPVQSEHSYVVHAEVADTLEGRQKGLIGRGGLQPGYGMLYVYDQPTQPPFDWQNMRFPVSAAFAREDGAVIYIRPADGPMAFTPAEPVKYVLEVRGGWFADRNLKDGCRLESLAKEGSPVPGGEEPGEGSPAA